MSLYNTNGLQKQNNILKGINPDLVDETIVVDMGMQIWNI